MNFMSGETFKVNVCNVWLGNVNMKFEIFWETFNDIALGFDTGFNERQLFYSFINLKSLLKSLRLENGISGLF